MFDQTQSEILDGLLIGDAYIPGKQNLFYFAQCLANRGYVEHIAELLDIPVSRVRDRKRKADKRTGKVYECSELRTLSHPLYAHYRARWYRDGVKVVPGDLQISPRLLLHWFLCDGACSETRGSAQMMLCTDSFTRTEVEDLRGKLQEVGIESRRVASRRLRIRQKSVTAFYEYIGECPVPCLAYKWIDVDKRGSRQQDLQPHYEAILSLYRLEGWSCNKIADKFKTNYWSIRWILKMHCGISFGKNATPETTCREGVVAPSETARRARS